MKDNRTANQDLCQSDKDCFSGLAGIAPAFGYQYGTLSSSARESSLLSTTTGTSLTAQSPNLLVDPEITNTSQSFVNHSNELFPQSYIDSTMDDLDQVSQQEPRKEPFESSGVGEELDFNNLTYFNDFPESLNEDMGDIQIEQPLLSDQEISWPIPIWGAPHTWYYPSFDCSNMQTSIVEDGLPSDINVDNFVALPDPFATSSAVEETNRADLTLTQLQQDNQVSRSMPVNVPIRQRDASSGSLKSLDYRISKERFPSGRTRSNSGASIIKKKGGRNGPLSEVGRIEFLETRKVGACDSCKKRKCKVSILLIIVFGSWLTSLLCDDNIFCKTCVYRFKETLIYRRCRDFTLSDLSPIILAGKTWKILKPFLHYIEAYADIDTGDLGWHPAARGIQNYFSDGTFRVGREEYSVPLILGFGEPLYQQMRIIYPEDSSQLRHNHISYRWPPQGKTTSCHATKAQLAFPGIVSQEQNLKEHLDKHIAVLLLRHNFKRFPLFPSGLHLLKEIYKLYITLKDTEEVSPMWHNKRSK